jgi:hypothetical protein
MGRYPIGNGAGKVWIHTTGQQQNQFFGKALKPDQEQKERKERLTWLGQKKLWHEILETFVREGKRYGWLDLTYTLTNLAKTVPSFPPDYDDPQHPVLSEILTGIASRMDNHQSAPTIGVRIYADIIHAIGQLRVCTVHDEAALRIVNKLSNPAFVKEFLKGAQPQDVADVARGLAMLSRPDLMEGLISLMIEQDRQSLFKTKFNKPEHPIAVLDACATLRVSAPDLFEMADQRGHWLLTEAQPTDVARLTMACATLGYEARTLFAYMDFIGYELVANGTPSDVATSARACAMLGHSPRDFFGAMDFCSANWLFVATNAAGERVFAAPPPQAIAETAWACATVRYVAPNLFHAIDRHAEASLPVDTRTTPYHLAITIWAFGKLGIAAPVLCAAVERRAEWLVEHGTAQDVGHAAWACATLGDDAPTLFAALDRRADWLVSSGPPSAIAQTAWACARLGHAAPALFAALDQSPALLVANGTVQDLADTTWACAQLGHTAPTLFAMIAAQRWEGLVTKEAVDSEEAGDDDKASDEEEEEEEDDATEQAIRRIREAFQTLGHPLPF